jgi:hypothetical protein
MFLYRNLAEDGELIEYQASEAVKHRHIERQIIHTEVGGEIRHLELQWIGLIAA